jgi:HK97 family phage major capsid protein
LNKLAPITPQKIKTRLVELHANKLALLGSASNELLADALPGEGGFESVYAAAMTAAVSWFHDDAFLNGDSRGKPLGVLNDPALMTVSKDGSQGSSLLIFANVAAMFARLHPGCVSNSVWVANSTLIPSLLPLQYSVPALAGTGLTQPALSQQNGQYYLLTRPVVFTEKLPAAGTKGDILLADFSQYAIGLR